jgi:hypothetical protein
LVHQPHLNNKLFCSGESGFSSIQQKDHHAIKCQYAGLNVLNKAKEIEKVKPNQTGKLWHA